jgi:hypothetical protein
MNNDLETQGGIMGDGDSGALPTLALQRQQHPVALAGTGAVMCKFNRDTMVLTVGLLGTVIFAGLVLVAQDLHPKAAVVTDEATQTEGDLSLNANPAALSEIAGFDARNTAVVTSDPATNLDEGFNAENIQTIPHANARSWSPAHRKGSARVIRPRIPSVRVHPSLWAMLADVKTRLFAFWHRKLAPTERSRGWTQFSNKWERKKVSYTAETRL